MSQSPSSIASAEAAASEQSLSYLPVSVSVIMPIRNEADFIGRSLGAVLAQDYPGNLLEVLVADGMSTDSTRQIISRLAETHPETRVVLVDNPARIVPTGFNLAFARSRGDVIVRVDGHTIVAKDYIRQCVIALQQWNADNVGGRMEAIGQGWFGKAVSIATSTPFGVGNARFHYSQREEWVDTVYMGAWPREVFHRIGLFDEEQVRNQDDEFNYRILECGGQILLSPHIKSKYFNRSTFRSLCRQYYQYGLWKVRVMQKHPQQMRYRQFVPPLFTAALALTTTFAPFTAAGRWGMIVVIGTYAIADLAASALTARPTDWRLLPVLALVFPTLHLSYGWGFLMGLVRFRRRWNDPGKWASRHPC